LILLTWESKKNFGFLLKILMLILLIKNLFQNCNKYHHLKHRIARSTVLLTLRKPLLNASTIIGKARRLIHRNWLCKYFFYLLFFAELCNLVVETSFFLYFLTSC